MKSFLLNVLATMVGILLCSFLVFFIFFLIIASLSKPKELVNVKPNSILHLKLDYPIPERTSDNPFESFSLKTFETKKYIGLNDILSCIKKAAQDSNIKAIYLDVSTFDAGLATIEEIRNALITFRKESKKPVIAYADYYTQLSYYLCSAADKIYLNPQGVVEFKGLSSEILFFKNAFEKLGIEPIIIRHGKFKSAVEPFVLDKMSPENKEQTMTYVKSIWEHMLSEISIQRSIPVERLNVIADSLLLDNAEKCKQYGFVNDLKYFDEVRDELRTLSGNNNTKDLRLVSLNKYTKARISFTINKKAKIAVLYAIGQIDFGEMESDKIGSNELAEQIREIREDSTIKALVLRVNSPGGNALASEVIWREMVLTKKVKPVVVSMGDVVASGGYYISCPASLIVANPTTITGSIGVFGLLWNGQKFMNDKLGLTVDGVQTNENTTIGSVFRPIKPYEQQVLQKGVEQVYNVFIHHVAEGRNMSIEEVDSIAQGRVWSGINAKTIKLIDKFGGLENAIEEAKKLAGIKGNVKIIEYPKQLPFFQQLLKEMEENAEISIFKNKLGNFYRYLRTLEQLQSMKGVQARLPYEIYFN